MRTHRTEFAISYRLLSLSIQALPPTPHAVPKVPPGLKIVFPLIFAFIRFCQAAVYTTIDVGVDGLLVKEYHERFTKEIANTSYDPHISWLRAIRTHDPHILLLFKRLTILWIASGGVVQTIVVVFLYFRGDVNLKVLPPSIQILTLISAPFLMGPVVVNVFAAISVLREARGGDKAEIDK